MELNYESTIMSIDNRTDKEKGLHYHDLQGTDPTQWGRTKNFDQKIYLFPESYNQLRKELYENWPTLWKLVGWPMAFAANVFVETMNEALDLRVILDSDRVDAICTEYLQALRKKRGLSQ